MRCAIYTRKSCEEGLEQEFNSLDAQRMAAENYIKSQQHEGWKIVPKHYDDGGFSGGNLDRPGLKELLKDIENGEIDCIVVYKIDRLSRSLTDFSKLVDTFDKHNVTFVSVTQSFNTSTSMGRLILHILLSFAQFERELSSERVRDKFAASKKKGMWMGGNPPLGYDVKERALHVNQEEAKLVKHIFERFLVLKSPTALADELNKAGYHNKRWQTESGNTRGGKPFNKAHVRYVLSNHVYIGKILHKGNIYDGRHDSIIDQTLWSQVQETFKTYDKCEKRARKTQEFLLKHVIRCHNCNASMTTTYTMRTNQQYRYYVCDHHVRLKSCQSANNRLAADDIERFVVERIKELLSNPEITAKTMQELEEKGISASQAHTALKRIHNLWHQLYPKEQQTLCQVLVKVAWVTDEGLDVRFHADAIGQLLTYAGLNVIGKACA